MLSLGCPKTLVDSELILGKLDRERFSLVPSVAECDIALVNTCAFIQSAQEESIAAILRLIELKKAGDVCTVIVMGCLPQRFPKELQRELKEVDAFVGSGEYASIPQILKKVSKGERVVEIGVPGYLYTSAEARISLTPMHSRYVKISEGCDHTCSFCVIPRFRGRHRSRPIEDILREAEQLVSEGARELILTGQDTTFFGYDLTGRYLLPELLSRLSGISHLRWIRVLYAYPSLVSNELIESIANLEKVCHYLDMPLQHISDKILRSMRRGTSCNSTRRLIEKLRRRIPDLAIRTTFIVGYPGETETEFKELLSFLAEARFERLGIFTYSKEEGSLANSLPGQVAEGVKDRRLEEAMLLQQSISRANNRRAIGNVLDVLLEEYNSDQKLWAGRTYMDAPEVDGAVFVKTSPSLHDRIKPGAGIFLKTRITDTHEYDLIGEALEISPA